MTNHKHKLKQNSFQRSDCPVSCALDILGDKWTMLVIRDLFLEKHRFSEFMDSKEGIKSNILTDRLKRLEAAGLVDKTPYQSNPVRYEYTLSTIGKDLFPVLKEMIHWSNRNIPGTHRPLK